MADRQGPPQRGRPEDGDDARPETVRDLDDAPRDMLGELENALDRTAAGETAATDSGTASSDLRRRIATDPDTVERDLIKLVLTVVELVRQLMERQALRRVDQGDLSEDQEERIGMTLMLLEERMTELRDRYDLTAKDLNLDLGPLGSLLPEAGD